MWLVLRHTKIGLIVRAGVQNGEMVRAMGYRLGRVFVGVFIAGSALAGLGGVMWGLYQEVVTAQMGGEIMVLVFIVVIIGGLGSVEGAFIAALLVGLTQNYVAFLEPKLALVSNIGLMVLILMWRPQGMMPVAKARSHVIRLLSGDGPRSWLLALCCWGSFVVPRPGAVPVSRARGRWIPRRRICVFIVLVASYDLLLGYAGIVSFAHTMFFGLGAYGVAMASTHLGSMGGARRWASPAARWRSRWRCAA